MKPLPESQEIDLRDFDFSAEGPLDSAPPEPEAAPTEFSWTGFAGGVAAIAWVVGAVMAPIGYLGFAGVAALHPALHIALAALVFGPAVLIWLGASAAAEAARTRKIAARIDARALLAPTQEIVREEATPLQVSALLREEIGSLNDAVEAAVNRLGSIEAAAARNIAAFENAISAGGDGAGALVALLDRERAAMTALNAELKGETEVLARNISRQIRLIQEASKIFKSEVTAAESSMVAQAETFGDIADVVVQRTNAFVDAADLAGAVSAKLDQSLIAAMEVLAQASSVNEVARQNAEEAAHAAHAVAGVVRDTTSRAVADARRAAEAVREEAGAAEEAAETALSRLRDMADAARTASQDSQAAADRHATVIERRLAALAETAKAARTQAPARAAAHMDEHTQDFGRARGAAGGATISRLTPAPRPQGAQDWRAKADDDVFHMSPANERGADPFGLANAADPDAALVAQVMDALAEAGVRAGEALTSTDLERIAGRARYGAAARRRAVNEAAPGAVQRLSRHFRRSAQAKEIANAFRSRPDLAKVNRRGDNADVVCAYLLIDTALS